MSLGMLGKYERLDVLGRGVSGIVYLAKDTLLNRQVALKEVDVQAGDLRRFLEEARVMDRLRHHNIVRVNGVDRIDDKVVIDMEYVRGKNLQELLRSSGPLDIPCAVDITIQILEGLNYAHSMQTVHRDIKPANILISSDGVVKLADFGLAEILTTNAYAGGAGTYAYMAPEDFAEENRSDSQSDIWAVGVTLFEMLTGERPFNVTNPKSPFAWKRSLENEIATPLDQLVPFAPSSLCRVVARSLMRDKELRYTTAADFLSDLREVQQLLPAADTRFYTEQSATSPIDGLDARYQDLAVGSDTSLVDRTVASPVIVQATAVDSSPVTASTQPDIEAAPSQSGGVRSFFRRQATLSASHGSVDFGAVRSGENRSTNITVRTSGLRGAVGGAVEVTYPEAYTGQRWVQSNPLNFDQKRQKITITADTDGLAPDDTYEAQVKIETLAGGINVPVQLTVIRPRPHFREIAIWFVPLLATVGAPAMITAIMGSAHRNLAPPAAASSLGLGLILLIITIASDVGIAERFCCAALMALMCCVLGSDTAAVNRFGYNGQLDSGMRAAAEIGLGFGALVVAQLFTARRWKVWCVILAAIGLVIAGMCYNISSN